MAVLNYEPYDRMPVVHFGFWNETLDKWADEGHITREEAKGWADGNEADVSITKKMGFDFNWYSCLHWNYNLRPHFQRRLIREREDGKREVMNNDGVTVLESDDAGSIPAEVEHLLVDRKSWEEHYLPRLQWSMERIPVEAVKNMPPKEQREHPIGLHCGSMIGRLREITGLVGLSYMLADDPALVDEMVDVTAMLCYQGVKTILDMRDDFDFAHFWEDIAYRAGPLVNPHFFEKKIGPYYKKITDLCTEHGLNIVSLDCDGKIDKLVPIWLENGVNTMFPIEVGVWGASIEPWREQYGKALRGIGGTSKLILSAGKAEVDAEVERMRRLVDLGGYIPCFDHRIPENAEWDLILHYTERMHQVFG